MTNQLPRGETLPSIFQTIGWFQDPVKYLEYCQKKYGDIFTMNMGPLFKTQVLIANPQAIKQLFALDHQELDSGKAVDRNADVPLLGNESIAMASGENHRRLRKLLKPAFHGEKIRHQGKQICQITEKIAGDTPRLSLRYRRGFYKSQTNIVEYKFNLLGLVTQPLVISPRLTPGIDATFKIFAAA